MAAPRQPVIGGVDDHRVLGLRSPRVTTVIRSVWCTPSDSKLAVYVLHAFQKKAKRGIATPKQEIDLVKRRLEAAQKHYDEIMVEGRSMTADKDGIERGSGNVFADLGLPDAEAHLLKAQLVTRIDEIIRRRGLKQVEAAKLLGLSQPDVSRLLRGDFREYSMERLLRLLTALGRDVNIVIRKPRSERQGRLSIEA